MVFFIGCIAASIFLFVCAVTYQEPSGGGGYTYTGISTTGSNSHSLPRHPVRITARWGNTEGHVR